jgi:hypothetical protein
MLTGDMFWAWLMRLLAAVDSGGGLFGIVNKKFDSKGLDGKPNDKLLCIKLGFLPKSRVPYGQLRLICGHQRTYWLAECGFGDRWDIELTHLKKVTPDEAVELGASINGAKNALQYELNQRKGTYISKAIGCGMLEGILNMTKE